MFGRKSTSVKRPKKLYDKPRIEEENVLIRKYGLKNKGEIWKAESEITILRRRAKELITADPEKQELFLSKLKKEGFNVDKIADVLALEKEDWLRRRLQTVLLAKGLVKNPRQARQLIVHKHVFVNENAVNIPSFRVDKELEDKITINPKAIKTPEIKKLEKNEVTKATEKQEGSPELKEEITGGNDNE